MILGLADGVRPVMAACAARHDIVVAEVGRCECDGRVAIVTTVTAVYMPRILAGRNRSVMAAHACPEHIVVIDLGHRSERDNRMAVLACGRRRDVIERLTD